MDKRSDAIGLEPYKSREDAQQGRLCPYEWMCLQAEYNDMDLTPVQKKMLDGIRTSVQTPSRSGAAKKQNVSRIGSAEVNCYAASSLTAIVPCLSWPGLMRQRTSSCYG